MKKGIFILLTISFFSLILFSLGWSIAKRLSWNTGISEWPVVIPGGTTDKIHVFWADNSFGNFEIFQKYSTDEGNTWSTLRRLTWTSGHSRYPHAISNSSGNIFISWIDETPGNKEIYFKRSTDDGASWSGSQRITWNQHSSTYPFLLFDDSSQIIVFWQDRISIENDEIFYKKSITAGFTWGRTNRLTWTSRDSRGICAAVDSSNIVHVVWYDWTSSEFDIFYKNGAMGGLIWSVPKRLTWTPLSCMDPSIVIDSNDNIYVIWTYNEELYFKKSTNGGVSWGTTKRLSWNPGRSIRQKMTIDSYDNLFIVWDDDTSGNNEIYYKFSVNGGDNWSSVDRLSWNNGSSIAPNLTMDNDDDVHIVWSDDSSGNYEIFHKAYIFGKIL